MQGDPQDLESETPVAFQDQGLRDAQISEDTLFQCRVDSFTVACHAMGIVWGWYIYVGPRIMDENRISMADRKDWRWPLEGKVYLDREEKRMATVMAKRRGLSFTQLVRYLIREQATKEGLL